MKLKELQVKKGYMNRDTIKGRSGSYRSVENQAEVVMTFTVEDGESEKELVKRANDKARLAAKDLLDDDADWIKDTTPTVQGGGEIKK